MKKTVQFAGLCVLMFLLIACAGTAQKTGAAEDSFTLDAAISSAASYFIQQLPAAAKVALVPFDAPTGRLSDYVFEEL